MLRHQQITQVRIGGFGGQGVVLAGALLGHAAVQDGLWVSGSNSYGAQARGGAARSEVVISSRPIAFPHVLQADVLVAMSRSAYDEFSDNLAEQDPVVIYDEGLVVPRSLDKTRQVALPATEAAVSDLGNKQVANIVMLGATAALTGIVSIEALETAVKEQIDPRFRDLNLRALAKGFELGMEGER